MALPLTDSLKLEWFINEAAKLNPNDPQSNGYGYAVAVLVGVIVLLVGNTIWKEKKRDKHIATLQRERESYRSDFKALVTNKLDELANSHKSAVADLRTEFKSDIGGLRSEMQADRGGVGDIRERLAGIEAILGQHRKQK